MHYNVFKNHSESAKEEESQLSDDESAVRPLEKTPRKLEDNNTEVRHFDFNVHYNYIVCFFVMRCLRFVRFSKYCS